MSKTASAKTAPTAKSRKKSATKPYGGHRPRIDMRVEKVILDIAFHHPGYGQDRVARELRARGHSVSASGVRYVEQRNNLETIGKRVYRIEEQLGKHDALWTEEQLIARSRVLNRKQARLVATELVGQNADEMSRNTYILAIAARVLKEQGYDATSLRDIAKRACIPLGSMYYHFQSQEILFAAVYKEGINRITNVVKRAIAQCDDPWDRLEMACITHLQHLCDGDDFTAVSIPTNLTHIDGSVRNQLTQLADEYEDIFRQMIAKLSLPTRVSPSLIRLQLLGALNWTRIWFKPGKDSAEEIARNLIYAFRIGLDQRSTKGSPSQGRRRAV